MFITPKRRGYDRSGQQCASGSFLLVFSHDRYAWEQENNPPHNTKDQEFEVVSGEGFKIVKTCTCDPSFKEIVSLKHCPVHSSEFKPFPQKELSRKLYACVRFVALKQLGHWMMGTAKIGGQSVTVSGAYGNDGLPMDYEKLSPKARKHLVELPPDLTEKFWAGGGWNEAGAEARDMHAWAKKEFNL